MTPGHPRSAPETVAELLALHDERFVRAAYLCVLGRQPDADGMRFYVERLRAGTARDEIVLELSNSAEARVRGSPDLAGIAALRARPVKKPPGLWSRLARRLLGHALEPLATELRVVENAVFRILDDRTLADHTHRLSERLDELDDHLKRAPFPSRGANAQAPSESARQPARERALLHMKRFLGERE